MREYLLVVFIAAGVTYLLGGLVRRFALATHAVTPIRDRDVHTTLIPRLGGVAILGGIAVAILVSSHLPFLGVIPDVGQDARALLLAGAVICLVGVIDDYVDLDPVAKLAGQVLAAGIVVVFGVQLNWLPLPNGTPLGLTPSLGAALTTLIIVGAANAVNFIDGLDGLCAGVVCLGASAFFFYCYQLFSENSLNRATTATVVTAAVAGACLGFLPHNFYPAKIFMGDSGAMLLGLLLAASTISLTGYLDPAVIAETPDSRTSLLPALLPLVLPVMVMALPFIDMLLAVVRRALKGKMPLEADYADRRHLHHRLLDAGHSHPRSVLILYVWAGLFAFGMVAVGLRTTWLTVGAVALSVVCATLFTVLVPNSAHQPAASGRPSAVAGSGRDGEAAPTSGDPPDGPTGAVPTHSEMAGERASPVERPTVAKSAPGTSAERSAEGGPDAPESAGSDEPMRRPG